MTHPGGDEPDPGPVETFLSLRPVKDEDCRLLWEWTNDPVVRAHSFHQGYIPWDAHTGWFRRTMGDPSNFLYLILDKDERPVGVVRFAGTDEGTAVVSITIGSDFRGLGYSSRALVLAVRTFLGSTGTRILHAYIKEGNTRSLSAFRQAGFTCARKMEREGQTVYEMVFRGKGG